METNETWYYVENGTQKGPMTTFEMKNLIASRHISLDTKVWSGSGDWTPLKQTILADYYVIEQQDTRTPPPLDPNDIDNRFVWAVVAIPLVGALIEFASHKQITWLYLAANIILCVLDEKKLTKAGHKAPKNWMAWIIPVYLWQRATILNQKKYYFAGWCAAFALSIFISFVGLESELETIACTTVTDIIKTQLYGDAICKKVTIKDKVTSGFYKGTAFLDNGNELRISIEHRKNGQVYVTIPAQ